MFRKKRAVFLVAHGSPLHGRVMAAAPMSDPIAVSKLRKRARQNSSIRKVATGWAYFWPNHHEIYGWLGAIRDD